MKANESTHFLRHGSNHQLRGITGGLVHRAVSADAMVSKARPATKTDGGKKWMDETKMESMERNTNTQETFAGEMAERRGFNK